MQLEFTSRVSPQSWDVKQLVFHSEPLRFRSSRVNVDEQTVHVELDGRWDFGLHQGSIPNALFQSSALALRATDVAVEPGGDTAAADWRRVVSRRPDASADILASPVPATELACGRRGAGPGITGAARRKHPGTLVDRSGRGRAGPPDRNNDARHVERDSRRQCHDVENRLERTGAQTCRVRTIRRIAGSRTAGSIRGDRGR